MWRQYTGAKADGNIKAGGGIVAAWNPFSRAVQFGREAWRSLSDLTDDRLVELARERNFIAFETLMRRHNRRLFRVTRSVR